MNEKWVNRLLYWTLAVIPAVGIYFAGRILGSTWFVAFLLFYLFIYKPALDIRRLLSLGKIDEKDAWRFFIPLDVDRWRYNKSLWLD